MLDAACGSGNFLYISLRLLMDLEKEVSNFCGEIGLQPFFPEVSPAQLYGIEINDYAHELAQATVWIGYLQWLHENGYGFPAEPILQAAGQHQAHGCDPGLRRAGQAGGTGVAGGGGDRGQSAVSWVARRCAPSLGDVYVDALFKLYERPSCRASADLVCYWFEKARAKIEVGHSQAGWAVGDSGIRGGANRKVLERIKQRVTFSGRSQIATGYLMGQLFMCRWLALIVVMKKIVNWMDITLQQLTRLDLQSGPNSSPATCQRTAASPFMGLHPKAPFDIDA